MSVTRRQLAPAAASLAALAATPAFGQQTNETVKWRLTSSFPKSLDTLCGAAATIARVTGEMTDGKFELRPFAAGEIVPGLQVLDAVANATVECGHTYTGYYIGKNPAFIFDGSLPFGLTPRMQNAWMMFGDGRKLMDEIYDSFGVVALPAGQTGGQMFGWFRKEIKTPADFVGHEDAHRGLRRQGHGQAGRRAAADCRRRHLSGAGDAARSTPANGSAPTTTRSSASTRWRSTTTRRASWSSRRSTSSWSTRRPGPRCRRATRRSCATPATTR